MIWNATIGSEDKHEPVMSLLVCYGRVTDEMGFSDDWTWIRMMTGSEESAPFCQRREIPPKKELGRILRRLTLFNLAKFRFTIA